VERQIRKLKKRKVPGRDGVQNEEWWSGTDGLNMERRGIPGRLERKRNLPYL
jgi:hypothetical protein